MDDPAAGVAEMARVTRAGRHRRRLHVGLLGRDEAARHLLGVGAGGRPERRARPPSTSAARRALARPGPRRRRGRGARRLDALRELRRALGRSCSASGRPVSSRPSSSPNGSPLGGVPPPGRAGRRARARRSRLGRARPRARVIRARGYAATVRFTCCSSWPASPSPCSSSPSPAGTCSSCRSCSCCRSAFGLGRGATGARAARALRPGPARARAPARRRCRSARPAPRAPARRTRRSAARFAGRASSSVTSSSGSCQPGSVS